MATGETERASGINRTFWLLTGGVFIVSLNTQIMNPVLPAIAEDFDASVGAAGLAVTAYLLPYGIFQLIYGPVADRIGRVRVIWMALAAAALGTLLCGIAPNLDTLILFRFLTGGTAAAVTPLVFTYVGDTIPYHLRPQAIGYTTIAFSLGNMLSSAVGGFLAAFVSWRAIFLIIAIVSVFISVMLMREPASKDRPKARPGSIFAPFRVALADRLHAWFYLIIIFEGMTVFGSLSFFGLVLRERDGFSYAEIGLITTLLGVGSIVTGRYLGKIAARFDEPRRILSGGLLLACAYSLMVVPPPIPFFLLAMFLTGVGFTMMHSTFQTRATELAPTARATGIAVFAFSLFVGGSIGSFLIAFSFENVGFNETLLGLAGLSVVLAIVAGTMILRVTEPHHEESAALH